MLHRHATVADGARDVLAMERQGVGAGAQRALAVRDVRRHKGRWCESGALVGDGGGDLGDCRAGGGAVLDEAAEDVLEAARAMPLRA